jgi:predicted RNase H-like HicB family nuclease
MTTKNDITGDAIITKATSDKYRENFDNIFKKPKTPDEAFLEIMEAFANLTEKTKNESETTK